LESENYAIIASIFTLIKTGHLPASRK